MLKAERAVMENPRRELIFAGPAPGFSVLLKRNCAISPAALATALAFRTSGRHAADYVWPGSIGREYEGGRHLQEQGRAELAAELAKRIQT
jgi:hypothetical protein